MKPQIDTDTHRLMENGKRKTENTYLFSIFHFPFSIFRFFSVHLWLIFFALTFVAQAQMKAIWVRPFINADVETRKDAAKGREFIRKELSRIKRANLNTVYLESFWDGYAIYPSKFAPQRPLNINYGVADERGKGWDVLQ
ncbi:MAG: hypothetical protein M3Q33_04465, partial [Acidobacteriota bacterium]|nr:hypothetical protein [Acidobacteriota bacterium]